nr:MAG TPA: virion assembly protein [Caudoviricetes sp.]
MASGGWVGHTLSKAWHGVTKTVKSVVGGVTGGNYSNNAQASQPQQIVVSQAAPAPTAAEQAEYDVNVQNIKKKRGKNSLYVSSSSSSSGGGTGINV